MTKRTEVMEVRLPDALITEVKAIANLAGLSAGTVIRVALATESYRHMMKHEAPPATRRET